MTSINRCPADPGKGQGADLYRAQRVFLIKHCRRAALGSVDTLPNIHFYSVFIGQALFLAKACLESCCQTQRQLQERYNLLSTNRKALIVPDWTRMARLSAKESQTSLQPSFRIVQSITVPQDTMPSCSIVYSLAYTQTAKVSFKVSSKYE